MHLVIFDIDGTLADTMGLDDIHYLEALKRSFNISLSYGAWELYKINSTGTDSGITTEILRNECFNKTHSNDVTLLKEYFLRSLKKTFSENPLLFKEIKGARKFFDDLSTNEDYRVGIATGSWMESGILKLKAIGIDYLRCPFGNSDLFKRRKDIISYVINESKKINEINEFSKITYFGDGLWDYFTAQKLGINFIGVNTDNNEKLEKIGAKYIVNDFSDTKLLYDLLG
jgi:phosphoglycolate phosphatase-like HAD superfamily hydrolase